MGNRTSNLVKLALLALTSIWLSSSPAMGRDDLEAPVVLSNLPIPEAGEMHFVPNPGQLDCQGTLEVQRTATIVGTQIRIRNVVRWADSDAAAFAPISELVIDRFDGFGNRKFSIDEIRSTLSSAGVNLAMVHFSGSTSCLISQSTATTPAPAPPVDDHGVVRQWIEQKPAPPASTESIQPTPAAGNGDADATPFHSLRERVLQDLSQRLNLPADQLLVTFDSQATSYLKLAEPAFRFQLDPHRVRDLGQVSWDVTITSGGTEKKILLIANARCWQRQLVMAKAANYKQILKDEDLTEKRVLVDHISDDVLLTRQQIVGQQAGRDLRPGMVLTSRLVDPVPLARQGDYVTVTFNNGAVHVTTVGRAMESGSYGQTIRIKNEQTQDLFQATMTGPQAASVGPTPSIAALDHE